MASVVERLETYLGNSQHPMAGKLDLSAADAAKLLALVGAVRSDAADRLAVGCNVDPKTMFALRALDEEGGKRGK